MLGRVAIGAWVRALSPSCFAPVMATGIVSQAVGDRVARLSGAMLGVAAAGYLILVVACGWRFARYRAEFLADAADPRQAFGYFTFVAGSEVLAAGLAADGHHVAAAVLATAGGLAWLLLTYAMIVGLITGHGERSALAAANGAWFLWTVGTQSIAVALTAMPLARLPGPAARTLAATAVGLWSVGVILYLLTAALVLAVLLHFPVSPAGLTPAYWVFMGATAISALAGARVLSLPAGPLTTAVHPVVAGWSVMLWAFGTWLIPLLAGIGVWRHLLRRVPLRYEEGLWSMVFPLGMWCVASRALGGVLGVRWLAAAGADGTWVAFAAWAVVFGAMLASFSLRAGRPGTARPAR